jgi:CheY-like chemotaxis protein
VGVGSVFRFDISIEEAGAAALPAAQRARRVAGLRAGEPHYRVLVADDAPESRELLTQLLEPVGFSVRSVADGQSALEEYERWHPQLILMDMRMPVMDGYETTRRIRATPGGQDAIIVAVTASAFSDTQQEVRDAGADEFIVKPFHENELLDKIGSLLGANYVHEEESQEEAAWGAAATLDSSAMTALPDDLRARIRQATLNADFDAVLVLAAEVKSHDERSAGVLRALAERFDSERILSVLPGE